MPAKKAVVDDLKNTLEKVNANKSKTVNPNSEENKACAAEVAETFGDESELYLVLASAKLYSGRWERTTSAMYIERAGCIVKSYIRQGDFVSETSVFVPGVKIVDCANGHGRKLVHI